MQSRWASYEVKSTWHSKKQSPSPGAEAIPGHHTLPRESFCSGKVVVAAHPWPEWGGGHYWMQSLRTQSGGFLHLDCLREPRGDNCTLDTFLGSAFAVMKYGSSSRKAV